MKNLQESEPVRFLEERLMFDICGFVQFKSIDSNQDELNPLTELKALVTNIWSVVLHEDSTSATTKEMKIINLKKVFIL